MEAPRTPPLFSWGRQTYVMGVINVTPDSFSDGGRFTTVDAALRQAETLVEQGAHILDIGGESTRPFSEPVGVEEELRRVAPVVEAVARRFPVPISIDTTKAEVAKAALDSGATVVNDISGLRFDPAMAELAASRGAVVVLMHMKGTPRDMQVAPYYEDVVEEVLGFLRERAAYAKERGIAPERIWIDPGIGFGKRLEDNLALLRHLHRFKELGHPLLVGHSRKSFIGTVTGIEAPEERDVATAAVAALAAAQGADVVRVHNVAMTVQALKMADAIHRGS